MRFCMLTTFYPPYSFGGDGVFVRRLSQMLADRGHHVEVIHSLDAYRALGGREAVDAAPRDPRIITHELETGSRMLALLSAHQTGHPALYSSRIGRVLKAGRFDVIHFHNVSLIGGPGLLAYGRALKLYTTHEHWLICPTHVLFKFNREPCTQRECLRCVLSYGRPPQAWRYSGLLERSLRHVDAFIAPSEFTRARHLAAGLKIPIVHIPYGLKGEDAPTSPAPAEDAFRPFFLFVGRIEKLKGLQTVIPLFLNHPDADLVVAGDGDYAPVVRRMAGDSPHIRFLGHVGQDKLRSLYARARALLVPSITFEVFGQVILEAFAERTPVIARRLGALEEIVLQSGGGLLYGDETELRAAMAKLTTDDALRRKLGEMGHRAWQTHWTEERHMEKYLGLIAELQERGPVVREAL